MNSKVTPNYNCFIEFTLQEDVRLSTLQRKLVRESGSVKQMALAVQVKVYHCCKCNSEVFRQVFYSRQFCVSTVEAA